MMIKLKIKLIVYFIMTGIFSAWYTTTLNLFLKNPNFQIFSLIIPMIYGGFRCLTDIYNCIFEIIKEKVKEEDAENVTKKDK